MSGSPGSIFKSSAKMSVVTMGSRVFGLLRDQILAGFLGTGSAADAFAVAFLLPNLLRRLFAEGAMIASFVPVFTDVETQRKKEEAVLFFRSFFTLMLIILLLISALAVVFAPYILKFYYSYYNGDADNIDFELSVNLTRIMFPYIMFISLAALLQGVLNVHKNFSVPAFTPVLLNLSIIGSVLGVHFLAPNIFPSIAYAFAVGVIAGGLLQFTFQIPFIAKHGYNIIPSFRFKDSAIKRIGRLFVPGIFGASVYQINVFVSYFFANAQGEGGASALMFSSRINELTLGVFAVSIATVMLPSLSRELSRGDKEAFLSSLSYSIRLLALICIPASVGLALFHKEIVSLIFEFGSFGASSVDMVSSSLMFLSIAIFPIAAYRVFAQSFYALKDTRTPVIVSAFGLILNAGLCALLPQFFPGIEIAGIALSNASANLFTAIALFSALKYKLRGGSFITHKPEYIKVILSAGLMAGAALLLRGSFVNPSSKLSLALTLIPSIVVCAGLYFGMNYLLKNGELISALNIIRRKSAK